MVIVVEWVANTSSTRSSRRVIPLPGDGVIVIVAVAPLAGALGALAFGQVLSIRRLRTHARAAATGRLDEPALAAGVRRIAWPVVLALYPLILGVLHLALNPPPTALLAALTAVMAASLLLDHLHAGWAYRRLFHTTGTRPLPPGSRSRIQAGQRVTAALYLDAALAGGLLLVATALTEIARPDPSPLATVVQLAAAAAARRSSRCCSSARSCGSPPRSRPPRTSPTSPTSTYWTGPRSRSSSSRASPCSPPFSPPPGSPPHQPTPSSPQVEHFHSCWSWVPPPCSSALSPASTSPTPPGLQ